MAHARSPLFGSTELARRIERAECTMLVSGTESAASRRPECGATVLRLAGGVATWAGDGSPMNKVAGLGFGGVPEAAELDFVEELFRSHGAPVRVELASLGDRAVLEALSARGYRLAGFENELGRSLGVSDSEDGSAPRIAIERCRPEDEPIWFDTIVTGFAHADTQGAPSGEQFPRDVLEAALGDLAETPGFERWLARRDGEVAGAAGLRISDGVAQLLGAATLPPHRRRGVQSALLTARLAAAAEAGCDLAVVITEPGSKSQQNVQRQGFDLLYTRAVLVQGETLSIGA